MTDREFQEMVEEYETECTCDPTSLRDFSVCKSCQNEIENNLGEEIPF